MVHPFETWPSDGRATWTWAVTAAFVAIGLALFLIGLALPEGGLLGLELATTHERVGEILTAWHAEGVLGLGAFGLGLDMAYLVAYGLFLAVVNARVAATARGRGAIRLAGAAAAAAWLSMAAAVLDGFENAFQVPYFDDPTAGIPMAAASCATVKFVLLVIVIGVSIGGAIANRRARTALS